MCGKNCCCLFTAKTGTLILLWITTISWGFAEVEVIREIFLSWMSSSAVETSKPKQKIQEFTAASNRNDSLQITFQLDTESRNTVLSTAFCLYGTVLAMSISGLFAVGKKKPSLLIPYFVYRIFWAFLICLFFIPLVILEGYLMEAAKPLDLLEKFLVEVLGTISLLKYIGEWLKTIISFAQGAIVSAIVIEILIMILEVHFTCIVYKYYRQMEKEEEKEKNAIPMSATWSAGNETSIRLS